MRHAQTDYNKKNLWMGLLDLPLNQEGGFQASLAANSLSGTRISRIYTSPLKRAVQTALQIQKLQTPPPPIEILDGLRERDFGPFEGTKKTPDSRIKLENSTNVESKRLLCERTRKTMERIESTMELSAPDESVLIVSHSNIFRTIREDLKYLTFPKKQSIRNAEYIKLIKPSH
ncbi:histidine phosphatase family protein [Chromohalobacter japonicus]|nr:histidine phosphatase family protein [Chromohalobacter japonicus]